MHIPYTRGFIIAIYLNFNIRMSCSFGSRYKRKIENYFPQEGIVCVAPLKNRLHPGTTIAARFSSAAYLRAVYSLLMKLILKKARQRRGQYTTGQGRRDFAGML